MTDANGAVTDDGVNQYTYGARGRLTGATTAAGSITYLVGPRGRRLAKTTSAGTTYYVYDQAGHLIAELDSTGAPVQEHIWLNDTPLAMAQGTTLYYVDTDQLNTPRALINATGTVVWRWAGEAFGDSPAEEDPDADSVDIAYNLRFPGQYYDRETNTFYNGARDYDPVIGRYLQSDPIGLAGGINTYAYVKGNPLRYIDPTGLYFGWDDAAAIGLGAVVGLASQGFTDLIEGHMSSWQDYAGSAIGGAAAGEASLYLGPLATGAVFGSATNLAKQGLKLASHKQCRFNYGTLTVDTTLGALLGKAIGPEIGGVTSGRGSYSSIFSQMVTKQANGTISDISGQTAMKMAASKQAEGLTGTAFGPIASAVEETILGDDFRR